jgi:hypothetical protein
LVELSEAHFNELQSILAQTPAALSYSDYASRVASRLETVNKSLAQAIIEELLGMLGAVQDSGRTSDEFAKEVADAALEASSPQFPFNAEKRDILVRRLEDLFGTNGLQITAKVRDVLSDADKVFQGARVLTDLRPVFDQEANEIRSAVVIHNLRIRYFENGDLRDFYVSLEASDVELLLDALRRALKKGALIESSVSTTQISLLK